MVVAASCYGNASLQTKTFVEADWDSGVPSSMNLNIMAELHTKFTDVHKTFLIFLIC